MCPKIIATNNASCACSPSFVHLLFGTLNHVVHLLFCSVRTRTSTFSRRAGRAIPTIDRCGLRYETPPCANGEDFSPIHFVFPQITVKLEQFAAEIRADKTIEDGVWSPHADLYVWLARAGKSRTNKAGELLTGENRGDVRSWRGDEFLCAVRSPVTRISSNANTSRREFKIESLNPVTSSGCMDVHPLTWQLGLILLVFPVGSCPFFFNSYTALVFVLFSRALQELFALNRVESGGRGGTTQWRGVSLPWASTRIGLNDGVIKSSVDKQQILYGWHTGIRPLHVWEVFQILYHKGER